MKMKNKIEKKLSPPFVNLTQIFDCFKFASLL